MLTDDHDDNSPLSVDLLLLLVIKLYPFVRGQFQALFHTWDEHHNGRDNNKLVHV